MRRAHLLAIVAASVILTVLSPTLAAADPIDTTRISTTATVRINRPDLVPLFQNYLAPSVICGPDLQPMSCKLLTTTYKVKNVGGATAPASRIALGASATQFDVPALAPGATHVVTASQYILAADGCRTVLAHADATAQVVEENEANNSAAETVCYFA